MTSLRVGGILAAAAATVLTAGSAHAATTFGSSAPPVDDCAADQTYMQIAGPPGTQFAAPTDGVITSWGFEGVGSPPTLKLKMFRSGPGGFTVVGESSQHTPLVGPNSYPTRIPVKAGDLLGLTLITSGPCGDNSIGSLSVFAGDPPIAATPTPLGAGTATLAVSAVLEPDGDGDGFGDETQDKCPADPQSQIAPCPDRAAPDTKITGGTKRSKDGTAKFKFSSEDADAKFSCKLKGRGLTRRRRKAKPCESPVRYRKLDPGRYTFSVAATDAAGNTDGTPAKRKFRILEEHG